MDIIYDNIIYSLQKSGGISVYWNMLEESISIEKKLLYSNASNNIFFKNRANEKYEEKNIFFERYRNLSLGLTNPFIFHSSYYRYCKDRTAVNITTLHDLTYELFRNDWKSFIHKIQKKNAVMHSDGVICISENTKQDLLKYYPDYSGKIKVIYHGYDSNIFKNLNSLCRTKDVLFVGSRVSYKNFIFTVKLLSHFDDLQLVIIGGGELLTKELEILNKMLPNRYKKLDYVSNNELARLYNNSFALAYPSDYEGFGFPVLEAQACGCPVICQPLSSIPEVSGGSCIYVNKDDMYSSIESIKKLFDINYYELIQEKGLENVKRFSWKKTVEETLSFYQEVYQDKINNMK